MSEAAVSPKLGPHIAWINPVKMSLLAQLHTCFTTKKAPKLA
jgi:hypothetical protein